MATCACATALVLAACSSSGGESEEPGPAGAGLVASRYTTPLAGICPDTVVVQTGWWPEPDQGYTYQLLGPNPTIDRNRNRVTGELGATGVELEIRAGGPAAGFQQASALMASDDSILLGYVGTDEAIQNSGKLPTVAVFSSYNRNPEIFLWGDPAWDFKSMADIGRSGATVLAYEASADLDVFEREGLLNESQIDTSYQGSPDRFVAADGKIVQQGFVTSEPYHLEHDVEAWGKPVEYLLVDEYPVYQNSLSVRQDKLAANSACLTKLVPLFQQAQRDYVADPGATNQLLLEVVSELNTSGYSISAGLVADANKKQKDLELIANGSDGVLGSFDTARVQTLIGRLTPVYDAKGAEPKPGLTPADLVTNQFLDKSVSLE